MTTLIDLSPGVSGGHKPLVNSPTVHAFELACEYLDEIGSRPFTLPELATVCHRWNAARQVISAYQALGFVERLSEPKARPVFYRIAEHALPRR
jgi:hypothetical protein